MAVVGKMIMKRFWKILLVTAMLFAMAVLVHAHVVYDLFGTERAIKLAEVSRFYTNETKVWAHRGQWADSAGHTENSLEAYSRALALGAKGLELDIYYDAALSGFVVSHDRPYHLHSGHLLMLKDVFEHFGSRTFYWLDFKNLAGLPAAEVTTATLLMQATLSSFGLRDFAVIESPKLAKLLNFKAAGMHIVYWIEVDPSLSFYRYWYKLLSVRQDLLRYNIPAVSMNHTIFNDTLVALLPKTDFYLFTINEERRLKELGQQEDVRILLSDQDFYSRRW